MRQPAASRTEQRRPASTVLVRLCADGHGAPVVHVSPHCAAQPQGIANAACVLTLHARAGDDGAAGTRCPRGRPPPTTPTMPPSRRFWTTRPQRRTPKASRYGTSPSRSHLSCALGLPQRSSVCENELPPSTPPGVALRCGPRQPCTAAAAAAATAAAEPGQ